MQPSVLIECLLFLRETQVSVHGIVSLDHDLSDFSDRYEPFVFTPDPHIQSRQDTTDGNRAQFQRVIARSDRNDRRTLCLSVSVDDLRSAVGIFQTHHLHRRFKAAAHDTIFHTACNLLIKLRMHRHHGIDRSDGSHYPDLIVTDQICDLIRFEDHRKKYM